MFTKYKRRFQSPVLDPLILSLLALLVWPCPSFAQFHTLKPGFESAELVEKTGFLPATLTVVRIDPVAWKIKVYRAPVSSTALDTCAATKSVTAINANFFGVDLQPLGLIISNSKKLHPLQLGGRTLTGVLVVKQSKIQIIHRDQYQSSDEIIQAVQAGPRLIADGQPILIPEDSPTRRSAIAIDSSGRILLFATNDRIPGLTPRQLQKILLRKELNIKDALNLDGGSSSQLYVSASIVGQEINISGGDKVPVFFIVQEAQSIGR